MTKQPDPLTAHRARVAACERELENARDAMRSRAKILGIPSARLFGDCKFVSRESAKLWVKDARAEMREEALENTKQTVELAAKMAARAARAAAGVKTAQDIADDARDAQWREWHQFQTDPSKCSADYLERHRRFEVAIGLQKLCKAQGLELSEVFGPGSLATPSSVALAERLVAGAQGRAAVEANDDHGNLAAAIVESGRRRRGESDATSPLLRVVADNDEPVVATPEAILLAGKRRRGEV